MKTRKTPLIVFVLISISLILTGLYFISKIKTNNKQIQQPYSKQNQLVQFKTDPSILNQDTKDSKFIGTVTEMNNGCWVDGVCSIKVDDKWVTAEIGGLMAPDAVREVRGQLIGISFANDTNAYVGKKVEVYAKQTENNFSYSIYGNPNYYIKLVQ